MRLRFGKPSLPLLMFFAAVVGAVFYYFDNTSHYQAPTPTVLVADNTITDTESLAQPTVLPTIASTVQFASSRRQDIPEDTSIFIPTAGIFSQVIQAYLNGTSWDVSQLRSNAGHLEGTPWVTQPGNVVISGHVELSSGSQGIFAALSAIEVGDSIRIESEDIEYRYIVTEVYNTAPTDLRPIMPTTTDRLTLITCNSYDIITNAYRERLIVVAERVSG